MAAWRAASAGFGLLEINWHLPTAVGHGVANVQLMCAGMRIMTRPAIPAAIRFVHMQEVQIRRSIAEAGQAFGLLLKDQLRIMATEAKLILIQQKTLIKRI